jgi:hypothetical protein
MRTAWKRMDALSAESCKTLAPASAGDSLREPRWNDNAPRTESAGRRLLRALRPQYFEISR